MVLVPEPPMPAKAEGPRLTSSVKAGLPCVATDDADMIADGSAFRVLAEDGWNAAVREAKKKGPF